MRREIGEVKKSTKTIAVEVVDQNIVLVITELGFTQKHHGLTPDEAERLGRLLIKAAAPEVA